MTDNIEVLAWIKIPKYNKKYNLSELLKMIGDLSKIWVFEQTSDFKIDNDMMIPIYDKSVNLSIVLYKDTQSLKEITS